MDSSDALFDTLRLMCKARPMEEQLKLLWLKRQDSICDAEAKCEYYYNAGKHDDTQVRATYRPKGRLGEDQLSVEFSLPKLTLGNNYETIPDFAAAIGIADLKLSQVPALPPLPSIAEMTVSRLDVCYNYFVGPLLPDYLAAFAVLDYPHRDKVKINGETVEFRAKSVKCKFYDKFSECHEEGARGLLRHETTLHRASAVKAALHKRRGTIRLKDITPDISKAILEEDLRRLGILGQPLGNFDSAELALLAAYGPSRASRLLHVLDKYQRCGRAGLVTSLGHTRNFINRSLLDIRRAGVPLALAKSQHPLPPLEVDL
jgi:hypothetical protein